ncbi:hypothetical protein [Streptomyces sp. NPDC050528]|uniref:hypothetical protein n=1 Tax=unclassified Streptomyces TaxID=2593676 RepID=UPI003793F653
MTSLQDPVMELVRASLDPAVRTARLVLKALDYGPADEKITFGQLLDSIQALDPAPVGTAR